jgi:decaprenyl-phosphate phosphoribosyltransferase
MDPDFWLGFNRFDRSTTARRRLTDCHGSNVLRDKRRRRVIGSEPMQERKAKPMVPGRPGCLPALLAACRPRQWPKNLLVFAASLFAFRFEAEVWLRAGGALVAFCLLSSAIYLLNDCLDVAADRAHPSKRHRPIAAGLVSVPTALATAGLLAVASLSLGAWITPTLAGVLLLYGLIQLGYCLQFKRMPLLDLFCIASGFLLRAIAGVVAGGFGFSPWFLLTVGLLALFLAIEKRKAELRVAQGLGVVTRKVLERYSLPLLLRLESLVATSAFMSYSLWAAGPALNGASTPWMLLTVPFALVGIFRYQLLSDPEESERRRLLTPEHTSETPEEILLGDRGIQLTLLAWLVTVVVVGLGHRAALLPAGGLQP